jgi:predicted site-specific integrase-resolvase
MRARDLPHVQIPVVVIEEPCLLRPEDVAKLLRVSVETLKYWRCKGHLAGPSFVRLNPKGRIRYQLEVVRDFIVSRTVRQPARIPKSFEVRRQLIDRMLTEISRQRERK